MTLEQFKAYISAMPANSKGCKIWTGQLNEKGYGLIYIRGYLAHRPIRTVRAHRAAWMATNGPIPSGLLVCHKCDCRPCINPDHLWIGTNAENMLDMELKGRGWWNRRGDSSEDLIRCARRQLMRTQQTKLKNQANTKAIKYLGWALDVLLEHKELTEYFDRSNKVAITE